MTDTVLVYDCFSGLSGDMHIGAMLDLGVPEAHLREQLSRLPMAEEFELQVTPGEKHGITGLKATIVLKETPHHHRHLSDITAIIEQAGLNSTTAQRALAIFRHIAVAEAHVHGISIDEVHFHEVGATDSIADIVAAAVCLDYLDVDQAYCRRLELGGGMVRCAHGMMPVPAPATAEILKGIPCQYDGINQEATTPTGAAILKEVVTSFSTPENFHASRIGYGLGQKDFDIPNAARVMLGSIDADASSLHQNHYLREQNLQIECNIDDMPAEAFAPLLESLLELGAKDAFLTPILMKKTRPGTRLTVLCTKENKEIMLGTIFAQSTSIGVRVTEVDKYMLPRQQHTVNTSAGAVAVKQVQLADGTSRWKLEHDQIRTLAQQLGQDYLSLRTTLEREVTALLDAQQTAD